MVKTGKDQHNWCTVSNKDQGLEQDCCHRQGQKACRNFVNNFILHLNNCWASLNGLKQPHVGRRLVLQKVSVW